MKTIKDLILVLMIIFNVLGIVFGSAKALSEGKCTYINIASFLPGYLISCELFERRWER